MADTQLIIDIAAKLTGSETTAELDRMSQALSGVSRWAESLDAAMISSQRSLDSANSEVARIAESLNAQRAELARVARAEGEASAAAFDHAEKVARLESDLDAATASQKRYAAQLAGTAKLTQRIRQRTGDAATRFSAFRGALGDAGGALGDFAGKMILPIQSFVDLREHFGGTTAALVTGVSLFANLAAAAVATATAIGVLTAAVVAGALALADQNREAGLAAEAYAAMHGAVSGVDFGAITRQTNLSADALRGLTTSLEGAKVSAADMPEALKAAALAEKALGAGGAAKFIDRIKEGKLAVADFAVEAQQKFGGIVERKLLGLGDQAIILKRNLAGLFGGLDIESALAGISRFVDMLSESHAVGRTIKFFFETIFGPFVDSIDDAFFAVEAFVLGFLIGVTKMYIAAKPAIAAIADLLGFDDTSTIFTLENLTAAGQLLAPVFAAGITIFGLFVAAVLGAAAVLVAVPIAIQAALQTVMGAIMGAIDFIGAIDMGQVASDLWAGFVDGIINFGPNVVSAITGVVGGAIDAAKSLLGIASPSKVFAEIGENTGEGMSMGVEDTAPAVQSALETMVEPPSVAATSAGAGAAGSAASAGGGIDLSGAVFNLYGVEGAEDAADRISEALTRLIEGDAAQLGAT